MRLSLTIPGVDLLGLRPPLAVLRPHVVAEQDRARSVHDAQLEYLVATPGVEARGLCVEADDALAGRVGYARDVGVVVPGHVRSLLVGRSCGGWMHLSLWHAVSPAGISARLAPGAR